MSNKPSDYASIPIIDYSKISISPPVTSTGADGETLPKISTVNSTPWGCLNKDSMKKHIYPALFGEKLGANPKEWITFFKEDKEKRGDGSIDKLSEKFFKSQANNPIFNILTAGGKVKERRDHFYQLAATLASMRNRDDGKDLDHFVNFCNHFSNPVQGRGGFKGRNQSAQAATPTVTLYPDELGVVNLGKLTPVMMKLGNGGLSTDGKDGVCVFNNLFSYMDPCNANVYGALSWLTHYFKAADSAKFEAKKDLLLQFTSLYVFSIIVLVLTSVKAVEDKGQSNGCLLSCSPERWFFAYCAFGLMGSLISRNTELSYGAVEVSFSLSEHQVQLFEELQDLSWAAKPEMSANAPKWPAHIGLIPNYIFFFASMDLSGKALEEKVKIKSLTPILEDGMKRLKLHSFKASVPPAAGSMDVESMDSFAEFVYQSLDQINIEKFDETQRFILERDRSLRKWIIPNMKDWYLPLLPTKNDHGKEEELKKKAAKLRADHLMTVGTGPTNYIYACILLESLFRQYHKDNAPIEQKTLLFLDEKYRIPGVIFQHSNLTEGDAVRDSAMGEVQLMIGEYDEEIERLQRKKLALMRAFPRDFGDDADLGDCSRKKLRK